MTNHLHLYERLNELFCNPHDFGPKVEPLALGTLEATDKLRRGYWLDLPLDMSNDDD